MAKIILSNVYWLIIALFNLYVAIAVWPFREMVVFAIGFVLVIMNAIITSIIFVKNVRADIKDSYMRL